MNNWNISGEILKNGIRGKEYPKLWLQVQLDLPKEITIPSNKLFINFDLDKNPTSKNGKIGEFVKNKVQTCHFFFLHEAMITTINQSKKDDKGEWISEEIIGVKGKVGNLTLSDKRIEAINLGLVQGKVVKYAEDSTTSVSKFIVEERYRNPSTNEWKSRLIPLLYNGSAGQDLTNKYVFVTASLCGTTPDNQSKVYGSVKKLIIG